MKPIDAYIEELLASIRANDGATTARLVLGRDAEWELRSSEREWNLTRKDRDGLLAERDAARDEAARLRTLLDYRPRTTTPGSYGRAWDAEVVEALAATPPSEPPAHGEPGIIPGINRSVFDNDIAQPAAVVTESESKPHGVILARAPTLAAPTPAATTGGPSAGPARCRGIYYVKLAGYDYRCDCQRAENHDGRCGNGAPDGDLSMGKP